MLKYYYSLFFLLAVTGLTAQYAPDYFLMVGTYTTTASDGIEVYSYNSQSGSFQYLPRSTRRARRTQPSPAP